MRTLPLASNHFPKIPPSNTIHCGLGFQRMIWDWGTNIQTIEWLSHQLSLTSIFTLPLLLLVVVSFSHSVMSHSSQPHGLQYARLPCPLPSPEVCLKSCLLSRWCYPAISPSVVPLLLLPSIFPSIRVFPSESVLCIRWPKYWRFSFSISPSNKYSGLTSLRIDWFDLLAVQRTLKSFLQYHMLSGPEKNKKSRNQSFLMIIRKCITVEVMFKESVVSFHDKCNIDIAYNNVSTLNPVKLFQ